VVAVVRGVVGQVEAGQLLLQLQHVLGLLVRTDQRLAQVDHVSSHQVEVGPEVLDVRPEPGDVVPLHRVLVDGSVVHVGVLLQGLGGSVDLGRVQLVHDEDLAGLLRPAEGDAALGRLEARADVHVGRVGAVDDHALGLVHGHRVGEQDGELEQVGRAAGAPGQAVGLQHQPQPGSGATDSVRPWRQAQRLSANRPSLINKGVRPIRHCTTALHC
jgi:hypothetical protein